MSNVTVKIGFVPSHRWGYTPWCAEIARRSIAAISAMPGVQVIAPKVAAAGAPADPATGATPAGGVNSLDTANAFAAYLRREGVDALVVCPLDFGDERSAAEVARLVGVPTLLYATKEPPAPEGDIGMGRISDSYCGNLAMAAALHRRSVAFHFAGVLLPEEDEFRRQVEAFIRAVAAMRCIRNTRVGQVGTRPEPFESVIYDESAVIAKFGVNVIARELSQILAAAQAIPAGSPELAATVADIRSHVAAVTVGDDYLQSAARVELALRDFCTGQKLSALAVQCWSEVQRLAHVSVCATLGRLTAAGIPAACEVDVLGAMSMLVTRGLALGDRPPHLIDWTIQHRQNPNRLLAWHCGNAPACLAADPAKTAIRSRRDMTGAKPPTSGDAQAGLYQFQVRPGPVTFCRLAQRGDDWKMLIARGNIVPSDETLAGTWSWVEMADHARLYRTLVEEGFIHHASMIHGEFAEALKLVCKFMGIRAVEVG